MPRKAKETAEDDFILNDEQTERLRELIDGEGDEEAVMFSDSDDEKTKKEVTRKPDGNGRITYKGQDAMYDDADDEDYEEDEGGDGDNEDEDEDGDHEDGGDDSDDNSDDNSDGDNDNNSEDNSDNNGSDNNGSEFDYSDQDEELSESDIDENFEFMNALREASNFKVKSRKKKDKEATKSTPRPRKKGLAALRRKIRREELPPEVKLLLGKANEAFVQNKLEEATKLYLEVVKMDKENFSAYKTLGEIARLQGDYNRCSNFWLLAAHIHGWDYEFWRELAELSVELGHQRQAVYCYTKAIRASHHKDYESTYARACLYRESRRFKRATGSLLALRTALPAEPKIVRELAKVYVDEDRVNDAITMYKNILSDNETYRRRLDTWNQQKGHRKRSRKPRLKNVPFSWSELNILTELYSSKGAWLLGIRTIRKLARWIEHREFQTFWDDRPDEDIEFDERRFDYPKFQNLSLDEKKKEYTMPIDIRVQLGMFRLSTKNQDEALRQFGFLLEQPINDTTDLYLKVGMELESFGLYSEALELLVPLSYIEDQNTPELVLAIAKCLRETQDFENAKEAYMRLLEYSPDDVEIKVALAEVCFYLNDLDTTARLYREAREQRSQEKASARANLLQKGKKKAGSDEENAESDEELEESDENDDEIFNKNNQALIADIPLRKAAKKKKLHVTPGELRSRKTKSKMRILKQYGRIQHILTKIESEDSKERANGISEKSTNLKAIASLWIDLASDLIEIFSMYRCFFTSERAKKFNVGLRKRTAKLSVDHKLSRMRYLQNEMILSAEMDDPTVVLAKDEFRGLKYEQWYNLFMKYALMIAQYESDSSSAMAILDIAGHINVFKDYSLGTNLVGLSVGMLTSDHVLVQLQVRLLMNEYQFCPMALKAFLASYIPDSYNAIHYSDPSTQKYILRQVKAYDSLREHREITGMAAITNRNVDLSKKHPYLSYIYASLLYFNKSYYSALAYCVKLYPDFYKDPSLIFMLALSNLNRSTQRKTLNTNFQILQALTYLFEYVKLKDFNDPYQKMEALYNVGRAFHQLELDNLAITFYEKVLKIEVEDESLDLKREAAYNLYIIYNIHENHRLAEDIMDKYLVV